MASWERWKSTELGRSESGNGSAEKVEKVCEGSEVARWEKWESSEVT